MYLAHLSIYNRASVPRDDREAAKWLQRSAEQGNMHAMQTLGEFYEAGRGVSQDYALARAWFQRGIPLDSTGCKMDLAEMYEEGWGCPRDPAKALAIYLEIASSGVLNANERIGRIYEFGRGVPRDYAMAFRWYDKAKNILADETLLRLAKLCEEGKVVPRDIQKAREYYRFSWCAEAYFRRAESLANEVPIDLVEAYTCYLVAQAKGWRDAEAPLARIRKQLTSEQRARAEADAKEEIKADKGG